MESQHVKTLDRVLILMYVLPQLNWPIASETLHGCLNTHTDTVQS